MGEPQRAFYGNQFGNTYPLFAHYGVPLWVPGWRPDRPDNEAHDLIMSVFGGVSKGERNRIKSGSAPPWPPRPRSKAATSAVGPLTGIGWSTPAASQPGEGRRRQATARASDHEPAAAWCERIFAEFLAGYGLYAIAERLTRDGIPSPSAYDPGRNRHRCGIAWSKSAIRAILINPRYTGRQVWNRQRKDEVLIDVHDVALGHTTKMRWNDQDKWIFSEET